MISESFPFTKALCELCGAEVVQQVAGDQDRFCVAWPRASAGELHEGRLTRWCGSPEALEALCRRLAAEGLEILGNVEAGLPRRHRFLVLSCEEMIQVDTVETAETEKEALGRLRERWNEMAFPLVQVIDLDEGETLWWWQPAHFDPPSSLRD